MERHEITETYRISPLSGEEIMRRIATAIAPILGRDVAVEEDYGEAPRISVSWRLAWSLDARLDIRADRQTLEWMDGKPVLFSVEVGSSSTTRTPAQAAAYAKLYARFAEAACVAESILEGSAYRPASAILE